MIESTMNVSLTISVLRFEWGGGGLVRLTKVSGGILGITHQISRLLWCIATYTVEGGGDVILLSDDNMPRQT